MKRARRWLGIDVGGTKVLGLATENGVLLGAPRVIATERERGAEAVMARITELAESLRREHGNFAGYGIGFPGLVDPAAGVVRSTIMLPGWDGFPILARLSERLGLPGVLDNDATAAGFGELRALGSPAGLNLVVLTVGTGIGGALVFDGKLYRGATSTAGELGNMTLDWQGGATCWCGNAGCWNMLASGSAIAAHARALIDADEARPSLLRDRHPLTLELVAEAARAGDSLAQEALDRGALALGAGLANLVNALNPDRIALCGGVLALGEDFLETARREAARRAFREPMQHVRIERCVHGDRSGAFGAAELAREALEERS